MAHRYPIGLVGLIAAGTLAVFYVPLFIPMPSVASESYIFGYNNRAGVLLFIALMAIVGLYVKKSRFSLPVADRRAAHQKDDSIRLLVVALAGTLLLCLAMWWFVRPYGGFSESSYFIDRLQLLLQGKTIYKGFEFAYGPLFLYGPLWLCSALRLHPADGYYLFWLLNHLIGTFLLWKVALQLQIAGTHIASQTRSLVFLVLWLHQLWQVTNAGVNYSPLRVALPLFFLLYLHHLDSGLTSQQQSRAIAFAAFSLLLLLSTSPEQALAFALVTLLYLPIRHRITGRPGLLSLLSIALLFAAECLYANHLGIFQTLWSFSSGGDNFPIFLNAHVLFIFAAALLCIVYLATGDLRERVQHNSAYIILYCCAALPAAFGRCDPLHMLSNEMGIVICAFFITWRWKRVWKVSMFSYVALYLLIPAAVFPRYAGAIFGKAALGHIYSNDGPKSPAAIAVDKELSRLAVRRFGEEVAQSKLQTLRDSVSSHLAASGRPFADATPTIEAPFLYLPNSMGSYQGSSVDTGFFFGTLNAVSPSQVQGKIAELRSHPERDLIVPSDYIRFCHEGGPAARKMLKLLFITPVLLPARHSDDTVMPLCRYINDSYTMIHTPTPETSGYGLWKLKRRLP